MTTPAVTFELEVEGAPLTPDALIIGALVRRLGGTVTLTPEEMTAVQGVVLWEQEGGLRIDAGNLADRVDAVLDGAPGSPAVDQG